MRDSRALFLVAVLVGLSARADSPLTSIDMSAAYADEPAVKSAQAKETERVFSYLSGGAPNDRKLAVMQALGWQGDWAPKYVAFLAQQKDVKPGELTVERLEPGQLFTLGYLVAVMRYDGLKALEPKAKDVRGVAPVKLLEQAAAAFPDDFAVQYALALVQAQAVLNSDWCKVFMTPAAVEARFPEDKRNLRPAALAAAKEYLALYEESCAGSKPALKKAKAELNQVYSVSLLGKQVVAGTQGGVVVWDRTKPQTPVAVREGFICRGQSLAGAVWIGCETEFLKWDGATFTAFLARKKDKRSSAYYEPVIGPDGSVWARLGTKAWKLDAASGKFVSQKAPWAGEPYDARFVDGRWVWIDFLRAVHLGDQVLNIGSEGYPGHDPRAFTVDELGRLWVQDFDDGLFRLEDGKFAHVSGLTNKGSGVAIDGKRKVIYLLHYTDGLVVARDGQPSELIDLRALEYTRDLTLDPDTGDVWVAGWNQLLLLRPDGAKFSRQAYRVP